MRAVHRERLDCVELEQPDGYHPNLFGEDNNGHRFVVLVSLCLLCDEARSQGASADDELTEGTELYERADYTHP